MLDSILNLCQRHEPALTQFRHSALESHEPSGSLAFEALLAHIDRLPSTDIEQGLSIANKRVASVPAFVRREVASRRSLRPLVESPSWPLVRSLTFNVDSLDDPSVDVGACSMSEIESIVLRGGPFGNKLIADLSCPVNCPHLKSLDFSGCFFTDEAKDAFVGDPVLSKLHTLHGVTQSHLESTNSWRLTCVSCYATGHLIRLLDEKVSKTLRHLTISSSQTRIGEVIEALLEAKSMLGNLASLTLHMDADDDAFAKLVTCEALSNLEHFVVKSESITAASARALQSASFLESLRSIDLGLVKLGDEGWQHLARVPFRQLNGLNLMGSKANDAGAAALASSRHLVGLTTVDISMNNIGGDGFKELIESDAFTTIESLGVQRNPLGLSGAKALASSEHANSLRHLRINNISVSGVVALCSSRHMHNLESLSLGFLDDDSTEDAVGSLAKSDVITKLRSLSLTGCVTDVGAKSLAESSTIGELRRLSLSGNVTGEGVEALCQSRRLSGLWQLTLDLCPIGDRGAHAIASSGTLHDLVDLQIALCKLTENGSRVLAQSDNVRCLRWISLNRELFGPWLDAPNLSPVLRARIQDVGAA